MKIYRCDRALLRVEVGPRGGVDEPRRVDEYHVGAEPVLHADVNLAGVERAHGISFQPAVLRLDVRLV